MGFPNIKYVDAPSIDWPARATTSQPTNRAPNDPAGKAYMCPRKHILPVYGPNILIILGGSKSFGTHI